MPNSLILWYYSPRHVHYNKIKKKVSYDLLPIYGGEEPYEREMYLHAKYTKKTFKDVHKQTELLSSIHSNICDLKMFVA